MYLSTYTQNIGNGARARGRQHNRISQHQTKYHKMQANFYRQNHVGMDEFYGPLKILMRRNVAGN